MKRMHLHSITLELVYICVCVYLEENVFRECLKRMIIKQDETCQGEKVVSFSQNQEKVPSSRRRAKEHHRDR